MRQTNIKMIFTAMLVVLIAGCGTAPIEPVSGPDASAAYGNITLPNGAITNVMFYKVGEIYAPPFKSPPTSHTYNNGNFFFVNLEPGKYFLMGFMAEQQAFYFNYGGIKEDEFMNKMAIEIKPGIVTYLGSYEVTGIDRHFFKTDTFDIKRSKTPTRENILNHLKEAAKGTGWEVRFEKAVK